MEIIKNDNKNLKEVYTNTVIIYQNTVKEAHQIEMRYNFEFGSLEIKKFKASLEVIKLKKSLSFIIMKRNKGEKVSEEELSKYIENEMQEYEYDLEDLVNKVKLSRSGISVSSVDERKGKQLFYKIAKLIHPDLHPEFEHNDELIDLWNLAKAYYENCDLEELERVYDAVVVKVKNEKIVVEITNIEEKILDYKKKIELIRTSKPYSLEMYLVDEPTKNQHKEEINTEIESLIKYSEDLNAEVQMYLNGGMDYVQ